VSPSPSRARRGFTLLEVVVVLSIAAVVLTIATLAFTGYFQRSAARRAAQLFAQDLTVARAYAVRSQQRVVIRFYESSRWYQLEAPASATEVARRRFGVDADIGLSALTLDTAGDSIVFDGRGLAEFSGGSGGVGTATFSSGSATYTVSFNGMGASKIDQS